MKDAIRSEKIDSMHPFADNFKKLHALPEHQRKIYAMATMLVATMGMFIASRFFLPPLQDLRLPSSDNQSAGIAEGASSPMESSQPLDNSQMADINKIPQIGPINGLMDALKSAKDLFVPKNMQTINTENAFESPTDQSSQRIRYYAMQAKSFSQYVLHQTQIFLTYTAAKILPYIQNIFSRSTPVIDVTSQ